jgi:hypothetical protein
MADYDKCIGACCNHEGKNNKKGYAYRYIPESRKKDRTPIPTLCPHIKAIDANINLNLKIATSLGATLIGVTSLLFYTIFK